MAKKLRENPIYIAPDILGKIDEMGFPEVIDERNNDRQLDPNTIEHKIIIYERQVMDWFLNPATNLIRYRNKNKGFIVLMICLSYFEGVEQYRIGQTSNNGRSAQFFIAAVNRLYPLHFQEHQLRSLYHEARCGLFHNGMVNGRIIINNEFEHSLQFQDEDIMVNPKLLLTDIKNDFQNYLTELRNNEQLRNNFNRMYSNVN